jgi:hypothetical protein
MTARRPLVMVSGAIRELSSSDTLTASLEPVAPVTLTDGTNVATDAATGLVFRLAAAGDRTLSAPTNAADAMLRTWEVTASGAQRTITLATGSSGTFVLTAGTSASYTIASGKILYMVARYDSTQARWVVLGQRVLA